MNKSILASLMYIIARFEKGRIPAGIMRRYTYRSDLSKSLDVLDLILEIIKDDTIVSTEEIGSIIQYVSNNMVSLSQEEQYHLQCRILQKCSDSTEDSDVHAELLTLMHQILARCHVLLKTRRIGYKRDLFYLLQAFHNLPRAYIIDDEDNFFGIRGISAEETIQQLLHDPNVIKAMGKELTT